MESVDLVNSNLVRCNIMYGGDYLEIANVVAYLRENHGSRVI